MARGACPRSLPRGPAPTACQPSLRSGRWLAALATWS